MQTQKQIKVFTNSVYSSETFFSFFTSTNTAFLLLSINFHYYSAAHTLTGYTIYCTASVNSTPLGNVCCGFFSALCQRCDNHTHDVMSERGLAHHKTFSARYFLYCSEGDAIIVRASDKKKTRLQKCSST